MSWRHLECCVPPLTRFQHHRIPPVHLCTEKIFWDREDKFEGSMSISGNWKLSSIHKDSIATFSYMQSPFLVANTQWRKNSNCACAKVHRCACSCSSESWYLPHKRTTPTCVAYVCMFTYLAYLLAQNIIWKVLKLQISFDIWVWYMSLLISQPETTNAWPWVIYITKLLHSKKNWD